MTTYLPYIFGLGSLLFGIFLFLYSFGIYKPNHSTEEEIENHEKMMSKFGLVMKICSVILVLKGCYNLINPDPDRYKIGETNSNSEWTAKDRTSLIEKCVKDAAEMAEKHPEIMEDYCECSMDKILNAMTKEQYVKNASKPQDEQIKEMLPLFKDCYTEMNLRIDSLERK